MLHRFLAVLVFAWPGWAHGYKWSLLITYPLHFEESYKASKINTSSTAILTCLPKQLIFCWHWGGRTGTDWDSSRHGERCPQETKLKPVHPRSREFTSPHRRLFSKSPVCRDEGSFSAVTPLPSPRQRVVEQQICATVSWFHVPPWGKVGLLWKGKTKGGAWSFVLFPLQTHPLSLDA